VIGARDGLPDRFGVLIRGGEASYQYIRTAVEWAQAGGRRHRHRPDQQAR
jgi:hypothetical protein